MPIRHERDPITNNFENDWSFVSIFETAKILIANFELRFNQID